MAPAAGSRRGKFTPRRTHTTLNKYAHEGLAYISARSPWRVPPSLTQTNYGGADMVVCLIVSKAKHILSPDLPDIRGRSKPRPYAYCSALR
jgi:hypothetical protein